MHFLPLLAVAPLLTLALDSTDNRHARLAKRAQSATKRASKVRCASYNYKTPHSLAPGSLNSTQGCGKTYKVKSGDTCASILSQSKSPLSLELFHTLNPDISDNCWNLEIGTSYCVGTSPCVSPHALSLEGGCRSYARAYQNETHKELAAAHNITLTQLHHLNANLTKIRTGRFYCVSNSTASSSPSKAPTKAKTTWVAKPKTTTSAVSKPKTTTSAVSKPKNTWTAEATTTWAANTATKVWQAKPTTTTWAANTATKVWKAKATTTTQAWKAEPTTTTKQWQPDTTTKAKAQPTSPAKGVTLTGDFTFYEVGLGSCGWTNSDDELVAAAPAPLYDLLGDGICGKSVTLHYGGNSVTVKIVDKCPPCAIGAYDLSPTAFQKLAPLSVGRAQMSWDASSLGADAVAKLAAAGY